MHGIDPVIGQGTPVPGQQRMFKHWDDATSPPVAFDFAGFVKMKGGEYFFSPNYGLKLRGVSETYRVKSTGFKVNGGHVGIYGNFYF